MASKLEETPSTEKRKSIRGEEGENKDIQPEVEKKDAEKDDAEKSIAEAKKNRSFLSAQTKIFIVIGTFAFLSLLGLVSGIATYQKLKKMQTGPLQKPLRRLRKTLAIGLRTPQVNQQNSLKVAEHLEKLPKYLEDAEKDYNNQKSKYQSIFRKGARSAGGWRLFGWSLYYASNEKKTWHDAESFCMFRDAHLASILSDGEQDYITSLLNESAWVGLSDENVEGTWEWADGSRLISQYWSPGSPTPSEDYGEMEQDCAFIDPASGRRNWRDAACHELKGWVCKESLHAKKA